MDEHLPCGSLLSATHRMLQAREWTPGKAPDQGVVRWHRPGVRHDEHGFEVYPSGARPDGVGVSARRDASGMDRNLQEEAL